jgi:hypothetical protein
MIQCATDGAACAQCIACVALLITQVAQLIGERETSNVCTSSLCRALTAT